VAARGGLGRFSRADGFEPWPAGAPFELVVVDTGPRPPTAELVAEVQRRRGVEAAGRRAYAALERCAEAGLEAVRTGDLRHLADCMNEAQAHLRALGLSTPALEAAAEEARAAGALSAKLTGAGGGGCLIALCEPGTGAAVEKALAHGRWCHRFSPLSGAVSS
ncbi:MAG: hypothetical protein D6729_08885, partial [Deltaproteobacteria bacterium]